MRILRHLFSGPWLVRRYFPAAAMNNITHAIAKSERSHLGELRFAVEAGLHWHYLWHGATARTRAVEEFSRLRVWDTEHNSGVLIYLLLADRDIEIIADRGIHAKVGDAAWQAICRDMESHFRVGEFEQGALQGIHAITALLRQHFPADGSSNPNELPDAPVVL